MSFKRGFTQRANAGNSNQQTSGDVKTAINRSSLVRRLKVILSVTRCSRKRQLAECRCLQYLSKFSRKTIINYYKKSLKW